MRAFFAAGILHCAWGTTIGQSRFGMDESIEFRPAKSKALQAVEWNRKAAAHLMRRAGFSASLDEIDRLVAQGFQQALDELLNPESVDDSAVQKVVDRAFELRNSPSGHPLVSGPPDTRRINLLGEVDIWLYRMLRSKHQLEEKLVFFWHDHFATSTDAAPQATLCEEIPLMEIHHLTIREHSMGNFRDFVHAIAKDPAMLLWLDGKTNIVTSPNENFARELLELFTIGLGNYTEFDIQEAARAFTGWSMEFCHGSFLKRPGNHDNGQKTFMGLTGNLDGEDIIDRIFEQHETARFMARKLWEFFVYPDPEEELVDELGKVFRDADYEIRPLMRALFERPEFFSDRAYRALVKSPTEMAVNFFREIDSPPASSVFIQSFLEESNQPLLLPPDVDGFPSGKLWLTSATVMERFNFFANRIAFRRQGYVGDELDRVTFILPEWVLDAIFKQRLVERDDYLAYFPDVFLQGDFSPDVRLALEDYLDRGPGGVFQGFDVADPNVDLKIRGLLFLILALPEYQMN